MYSKRVKGGMVENCLWDVHSGHNSSVCWCREREGEYEIAICFLELRQRMLFLAINLSAMNNDIDVEMNVTFARDFLLL